MAIRGKPPERGGVGVSFTFDKCPPGEKRAGWLAGAVHGIYCHCSGTSKPCLRVLLGERAECAGCRDGKRTGWVGYVPVRRHDGRPFVVAIREATAAVVDRITPGARVVWGRDEGRGESVYILESPAGPEWRHYYPDTPPNADLTSWLVRLWRMPALAGPLAEWFRAEATCTPPAEPLPAPAHVQELPRQPPAAKDRRETMVGEELNRIEGMIARRQRQWREEEAKNGDGH